MGKAIDGKGLDRQEAFAVDDQVAEQAQALCPAAGESSHNPRIGL